MSSVTGISKERRLRVLDSVGGPWTPTPSELASWLRSLPSDMTSGEIASVLESTEKVRFKGKRVKQVPKAASEPIYQSADRYTPKPYNPAPVKPLPRNPVVREYIEEKFDPPRSLLAATAEKTADTGPTVRQAVILERLEITSGSLDDVWRAIQLMTKLCYEHEQGPLLAEILHRYPHSVDRLLFLPREGKLKISLITDEGDRNSDLLGDPNFGVDTDSATELDMSRALAMIGTSDQDRVRAIESVLVTPSDELFDGPWEVTKMTSKSSYGVSCTGASSTASSEAVTYLLTYDGVDITSLTCVGEVTVTPTELTLSMVNEAIDQSIESKRLYDEEIATPSGNLYGKRKYTPLPGHKVIDDLVFEYDRNRAHTMLDKPKHVRVRTLESVLAKDPDKRGPFTVTNVGDFVYLLFKGVEIVSLWSGETPVPRKPRGKKTLGSNKLRKKEWFEIHRTVCAMGCSHCHRFGK